MPRSRGWFVALAAVAVFGLPVRAEDLQIQGLSSPKQLEVDCLDVIGTYEVGERYREFSIVAVLLMIEIRHDLIYRHRI